MGHLRVSPLLGLLLVLSLDSRAFAQAAAPGTDRPPPGTVSSTLAQVQRWFELDAPFSHRLKVTFDTRPIPTYEMLQLPTFEGRALLWQRGSLSLSLFERVAPALALDCSKTCVPTEGPLLQQSFGFDARADLGRVNRQIPSTFLFVRPEMLRVGKGFYSRAMLGIGGLLDL